MILNYCSVSRHIKVNLAQALAHELPLDIVCDKLDEDEKQSLCDEAMEHRINLWHGSAGGRLESFLDEESDLEVPKLANKRDPYTCKEILVVADMLDMYRDMYWCKPRRYIKTNPRESHQWRGFFISGSRKIVDQVFLFEAPTPHSECVYPEGKMESVELLSEKAKTLPRFASSSGEN